MIIFLNELISIYEFSDDKLFKFGFSSLSNYLTI